PSVSYPSLSSFPTRRSSDLFPVSLVLCGEDGYYPGGAGNRHRDPSGEVHAALNCSFRDSVSPLVLRDFRIVEGIQIFVQLLRSGWISLFLYDCLQAWLDESAVLCQC